MVHLRSVALAEGTTGRGFPLAIPALRDLSIAFEAPVTILVGENGCGKSTLLEALAWSTQRVCAGSRPLERDPSLEAALPLAKALRPVWNKRTPRGFFLRAEDFFGFVKNVNRDAAEYAESADRVRAENPHATEGELSRISAPFAKSSGALRARYGDDMDARSHGEQFLAFFQARLVPGGLYLLDEPEAPLSPSRQLAFLSLVKQASEEHDCQFVIATHAPILMALPGATLLSFDAGAPQAVGWNELEHVRLTRDFLNRPDAFLRHL